MLLALPADCKLKIILAARTKTREDRRTLSSLLIVCKDFNRLFVTNATQIEDHYTMKTEMSWYTIYTFCGHFHRNGDLPAVIWKDGTQKWYRYNKPYRDGGLPAITRPITTMERGDQT